MFFQKVLKGISGLSRHEANKNFEQGIVCNWWRTVHTISPPQVVEKLTERNLEWHLNHYDELDPLTGNTAFCENTPFISVTAGVVERQEFLQRNIVFDPLVTALRFATSDFSMTGHIFYGYVFTLGRQSIDLAEFAEEVRELNIYKNYLPIIPKERSQLRLRFAGRKSRGGKNTMARRRSSLSSSLAFHSRLLPNGTPFTHRQSGTVTFVGW